MADRNIFTVSPYDLAQERYDRSILDALKPQEQPKAEGLKPQSFEDVSRLHRVPQNVLEAVAEESGIADPAERLRFAEEFGKRLGAELQQGKPMKEAMQTIFGPDAPVDDVLRKAVDRVKPAEGQPAPEVNEANPGGTALGRAVERGIIRTKSTIPAWKASRAADTIREADSGFASQGGMQDKAAYLRQQATELEAELPKVEQADPEAAAQLREEITLLRQQADQQDMGSDTLTMKRRQGRLDDAADDAMETGAKALTDLQRLMAEAEAIPLSPAGERAKQRLADAEDTWGGALSALAASPLDTASFLAEVAAESTPQIAASAAAAIITRNPALATAMMGGGTMTQEYGASVGEYLQRKGAKFETLEDAAAVLQDTELMAEADAAGLKRGIIIAASEMLGMQGARVIDGAMSPVRGALASTGLEMATAGGGEAAAMAATGQEISPKEVIVEALAEAITAPAEIGIAVRTGRRERQQAEAEQTPPQPAPAPAPEGALSRAAAQAGPAPEAPEPLMTGVPSGARMRVEIVGGQPVEAEFVEADENTITLKVDGSPVMIPREDLESGDVSVSPVDVLRETQGDQAEQDAPARPAEAPRMQRPPEPSQFIPPMSQDMQTPEQRTDLVLREIDNGVRFLGLEGILTDEERSAAFDLMNERGGYAEDLLHDIILKGVDLVEQADSFPDEYAGPEPVAAPEAGAEPIPPASDPEQPAGQPGAQDGGQAPVAGDRGDDAAPVAGAEQPAEGVAPTEQDIPTGIPQDSRNEPATAWDGMAEADREQALIRAGYATKAGNLNAPGRKALAKSWADMSPKMRQSIEAAPQEGGEKTPPVDTPPAEEGIWQSMGEAARAKVLERIGFDDGEISEGVKMPIWEMPDATRALISETIGEMSKAPEPTVDNFPIGDSEAGNPGPRARDWLSRASDDVLTAMPSVGLGDNWIRAERQRRKIGEFAEKQEPAAAKATEAKPKAKAPKDFWAEASDTTRRELLSELGVAGAYASDDWSKLDSGMKRRISSLYRKEPEAWHKYDADDRARAKARKPVQVKTVQITPFMDDRPGYTRQMVNGERSSTQTRMTDDGYVVKREVNRTQVIGPNGAVLMQDKFDVSEDKVNEAIENHRAIKLPREVTTEDGYRIRWDENGTTIFEPRKGVGIRSTMKQLTNAQVADYLNEVRKPENDAEIAAKVNATKPDTDGDMSLSGRLRTVADALDEQGYKAGTPEASAKSILRAAADKIDAGNLDMADLDLDTASMKILKSHKALSEVVDEVADEIEKSAPQPKAQKQETEADRKSLQAREAGRNAARQGRTKSAPGWVVGTPYLQDWNAGFDEQAAEQNDTSPTEAKPAPAAKPKAGILGALSDDKQARAAELKAKLAAKARNQTSAGIDPEYITLGGELVGLYIEAGTKRFAEMLRDFAETTGLTMREAQAPMRAAYNFVRDEMDLNGEDVSDMDSADQVMAEIRAALAAGTGKSTEAAPSDTLDAAPNEESNDAGQRVRDDAETALEAMGPEEVRPLAAPQQTERDGGSRGGANRGEGDGNDGARDAAPRGGRGGSGRSVSGTRKRRVKKADKAEAADLFNLPAPPKEMQQEIDKSKAPAIPGQNFTITPDLRLGQGGPAEKFSDNIAAIETLKRIEAEGRRATPEEQHILARYVGWGGLKNAFRVAGADEGTGVAKGWEDRVAKLEDLLEPEELKAARNSTKAAHYTSETVVKGLWKIAQRVGFSGGAVLEPSAGVGNFIGLMPEALRGKSNVMAVEYDSITARIAKHLYPQATVFHSGFQNVPLPAGRFGLAIGNPPFGRDSLYFQHLPEVNRKSIHNQFFQASMTALAPDAPLVMVVSRYLMDAQDPSDRIALARLGTLEAAIRLPSSAFQENARTEVITDILVFRKHTASANAIEAAIVSETNMGKQPKDMTEEDSQQASELTRNFSAWLNTTQFPDPAGSSETLTMNRYFQRNPAMVLGDISATGTLHRNNELNVTLPAGEIAARLDDAIQRIPESAPRDAVAERTNQGFERLAEAMALAIRGAEPGSVRVSDDGRLLAITERIEGDQAILEEREITADTPYTKEYFIGEDGKWRREIDLLDDAGKKVKKRNDEGKLTNLNVKTIEVIEDTSTIPGAAKWGEKRVQQLRDMLPIRDAFRRQVELEAQDAPNNKIEANRAKLKEAYEKFKEAHGALHQPRVRAIADNMPDGGLVLAVEDLTSPPGARKVSVKPAGILSERVIVPPAKIEQVETLDDAISTSLSETGGLDMARMAELLGKDEAQIEEMLSEGDAPRGFFDPEQSKWVTSDEYLSGEVRRKLAAADRAGLTGNVDALSKVAPEPWGPAEITPSLGSNWIPTQVYADFMRHIGYSNADVRYQPLTNTYTVSVDGKPATQWDTSESRSWSPANIAQAVMNSAPIKITYKHDDKTYVDEDATRESQARGEELFNEFQDWAFADDQRRDQLVDIFNNRFNTRITRQRDGSHLKLPGLNPAITPRRHQKNAIWRGVTDRVVLFDHVVGAGKTIAAIARIMERRRMGLSRKPLVVVPNHLTEQWAKDWKAVYPGARLLVAGKSDFEKANRRRLFARIAAGDYDGIIIGHSQIGMIDIDPSVEISYLDQELKDAIKAVKDAEEVAAEEGLDQGWRKPMNVAEAERLVTKIEERMAKVRARKRDKLITFQQMGIDDLTIDEAHEFKNLQYSSRLTGVAGMGNKTGSQKAIDLHLKLRSLHDAKGSIAFLTGTPISNSVSEMYLILRNLAPDQLREMGLENFDAWRTMFVSASSEWEPTEAGGLKEVTRLGREWTNMRTLMDLYYSVSDAVTLDDIKAAFSEDNNGAPFPVPRVKGVEEGESRKMVAVKPTPKQASQLNEVIQGFDSLPYMSDPKERNAQRLRLMDMARKVALDARAVDPRLEGDEGGKIGAVVDNVTRIYKQWDDYKGTQIVFLDRSVPSAKGDAKVVAAYDEAMKKYDEALKAGDDKAITKAIEALDKFDKNDIDARRDALAGGWNAYDEIKNQLVLQGIPAEEIRFVQEADTEAKKKNLFEQVRKGQVRVLIGSTPRMGAGTNVQDLLVALHHVDVTWKPSDIEQREGRIIRQGNKLLAELGMDNFAVEVLAYATERTVDAKMWDLNGQKLKAINGIRKYDGSFLLEFEDADSASMAEMAALATGNPLMVERIKLDGERNKLMGSQRRFNRKRNALRSQITNAQRIIARADDQSAELMGAAEEVRAAVQGVMDRQAQRSITVAGKVYNSAEDATEAAAAEIAEQRGDKAKGRFKIDIDGLPVTTQEDVNKLVKKAFGAPDFEASVGGETITDYMDAGRAMAAALNQALADQEGLEQRILDGLTVQGLPMEVTIYPQFGDFASHVAVLANGLEIATNTYYSKNGAITSGEFAATLRKFQETISPERIERQAKDVLRDKERSEAELPDLQQQAEQDWPEAARMKEVNDRLDEVISAIERGEGGADGETEAPDGAMQKRRREDGQPDSATMKALTASFNNELAAMGFGGRVKATAWRKIMAGPFRLDGFYMDAGVGIAADAADPRGVLHHELIHALRDPNLFGGEAGIFTAAEWRSLVRAARANKPLMARVQREYADQSTSTQTEEAVAEMFREWMKAQEASGPAARTLGRIRDALTALANALIGNGFTSAGRVFRQIASGNMGKRMPKRDAQGRFVPDDPDDTPPGGGGRKQSRRESMFFSPALEFVRGAKQKAAPAADWKAILSKAPGVKKAELEWLGVEDWLDGQPGQVTRDELAAFIDGQKIEIVEEVSEKPKKEATEPYVRIVNDGPFAYRVYDANSDWEITAYADPGGYRVGDRVFETANDLEAWAEGIASEDYEPAGFAPSFEGFTEDGGTNYREVLLRVPNLHQTGKNQHLPEDVARAVSKLEAERAKITASPGSQEYLRAVEIEDQIWALEKPYSDQRKRPFVQDQHFEQENIVVHARVKDRTGPNGERVLFVEEIQSDLASAWRENSEPEAVTARRRELRDQIRLLVEEQNEWLQETSKRLGPVGATRNNLGEVAMNSALDGAVRLRMGEPARVPPALDNIVRVLWGDEWQDARDRHQAYKAQRKDIDEKLLALGSEKRMDPTTPDTPFKEELTYQLMVKRLLQMAAREGYDRLAWTPAYMQAIRWDKAEQTMMSARSRPGARGETIVTVQTGDYLEADFVFDKDGKLLRYESEENGTDDEYVIARGKGGSPDRKITKITDMFSEREAARMLSGEPVAINEHRMIDRTKSGYAVAYDVQTRKAVDKLARKYGAPVYMDRDLPDFQGTLVGSGKPDPLNVWSVDITDSLRASAAGSQPMFKRRAPDFTDAPLVKAKSFKDGASQLVSDALTQAMNGAKGANLLALVPGRALLSELGKNMPAAQKYLSLKVKMDTLRNEKHAQVDELAQAWRKLIGKDKAGNKRMMDLMHEATIEQIDPSRPFAPIATAKDRRILETYNPDSYTYLEAEERIEKDKVRLEAWTRLHERYKALPQPFQRMFGRVRDAYSKMADEFEMAIRENAEKAMTVGLRRAEREHAREMDRIKDEGLTGKEKAEAIEAADAALKTAKMTRGWSKNARMAELRKRFESNRLQGPYFPLARFGDFYVTLRDEDGKVVSFSKFESARKQRQYAEEMKKEGFAVETGTMQDGNARDMVDPNFVADIEALLDEINTDESVMDAIWQNWLNTLPDMSMRKSRIHRKGTPGFDDDAFRAFGHQMFHGAHQLARLKYALDLSEQLDIAEEEARLSKDPVRTGLVLKEIKQRHDYVMNPQGSWWSQMATSAAFVYYLSVTPAAALVNLTQTTVVGIPMLGAFYGKGGQAKAAKELTKAMRDFAGGKGYAERGKNLTGDERAAMREAYNRGVVDKSQSHDLAGVGETGVEYSVIRTRIMGAISAFFHHAERTNREVTFLAGYRLARQKGMDHEAAIEAAGDVTWKTHFDYQNTSRPRLMQNDYMRVLMVFRNFQINMLWRLFRDIHQTFNGEGPEARAEARRQLIGVTTQMMLHAGVKGVWGYSLIMALLGAFSGEDDDPEKEMEKAVIGLLGAEAGGMILNGVPGHLLGIDLQSRVGMPDLWFRSPDRQLEGEDEYTYWLQQVVGAVPGIAQNLWRGASQAAEGNIYRGVETAMPKFFRDLMRTGRYWMEGATTYNGDPIIEDFRPGELFAQALGFTPARLAERYDANRRLKNEERAIEDRRSALVKKARESILDGKGITPEIRDEIAEFNRKMPQWPIMPDNVRSSVRSRQQAAERNEFGAILNPRLNGILRENAAPLIYD